MKIIQLIEPIPPLRGFRIELTPAEARVLATMIQYTSTDRPKPPELANAYDSLVMLSKQIFEDLAAEARRQQMKARRTESK